MNYGFLGMLWKRLGSHSPRFHRILSIAAMVMIAICVPFYFFIDKGMISLPEPEAWKETMKLIAGFAAGQLFTANTTTVDPTLQDNKTVEGVLKLNKEKAE